MGKFRQENTGFNYNGESNLDIDYAIALGMTYFHYSRIHKSLTVFLIYPQKIALSQVGDIVKRAFFNNFINLIDGSYGTFDSGHDPTV